MDNLLEKLGLKRARNKNTKTTNPNLVANEVQKRVIVFGVLIVLSLTLIIGKLFMVQVVSNESYVNKLASYTRRFETITTPRGEFLDRNGNLIVTNKINKAIIYYPPSNAGSDEKWQLAKKFIKDFKVDDKKMNQSDLEDLYLFLNEKEIRSRITESEMEEYETSGGSVSDFNDLIKSKITKEDIESLDDDKKDAYKIYQRMTMSTSGGMKIITEDVTNEEIAYLAENNFDFPGFQSYSNWDREYLEDYGLKSIIGTVSTETQGIPAEKSNYYLAKDYARNERMGRSGLELYYEDIVRGDKKIQDVQYSEDGFANPVEVREGAKGDNITLTIDMKLQKETEKIAKKYIEKERGNPNRLYFDNVYLIASNPKNGDILSSVAVRENKDGELYNDPSLNHLDAVAPGSAIKGAMVYLGLSEGAMSPTEQVLDTPIKIASTPLKSSYNKNLVSTNAISALAESSNVYMFQVALRVAEARYEFDQPLYGVDIDDFHIMKENFSRFGLGSKTGIDMPLEEVGYIGKNAHGGLLLDYAIGQYDSYTPMQLATYINTIANNGIRVAPRYVQYALDPLTDIKVFNNDVEVMSTLDDKESLSYVHKGFRACVTDGLCRGDLTHDRYAVAAKTGTAENTFVNKDNQTIMDAPHSLLTAYAPYEDPEITVTCVTKNSTNGNYLNNICQPMANEVFEYYFNNK